MRTKRIMAWAMAGALFASTSLAAPSAKQPATQPVLGVLPGGAEWTATVPDNWNGTLLVWSHGYTRERGKAEDAPKAHRAALLAAGYAIAGSSYAQGGWAVQSAIPDQIETIAAFTRQYGKPRRVVTWGMSMGALISVALAERPRAHTDGTLALCGSIGGAVGMMNMALDGAYAFRTLVAPDAGIALTGINDDMANGKRVEQALAVARTTPQGRARVALAAVLAGLPGWTVEGAQEPAPGDAATQEEQMAKTFTMGVFLPRSDQEQRAGGSFSWNDGVNYRQQLQKSGRRALVESLYKAAGLDLSADLQRLEAGSRLTAKRSPVRYMLANYTPNARPLVPVLAVQNIGDGLTSPSLQQDYVDAAARRAPGKVAGLWTAGAGHCTFDTQAILAALTHLETRLDKGRWPERPAPFVAHTPPPMLRPCLRGGRCR